MGLEKSRGPKPNGRTWRAMRIEQRAAQRTAARTSLVRVRARARVRARTRARVRARARARGRAGFVGTGPSCRQRSSVSWQARLG